MKKPDSYPPPRAPQKPETFELHGDIRLDEYAWLRDATNPATTAYVKSENAYADAYMKPTERLRRKLYREIRARMREDDMSVPAKDGPYYYYTRTRKGKQYAIHCRKRGERGKEEIVLDENMLARGNKYFSLGDIDMNPDHTIVGYTTDTTGAERYILRFKNLATGELLTEYMESVGDFEWAEDGRHILYTIEEHPHPPRRVYLHRLGAPVTEDKLIYEEPDPQWYVAIGKSNDERYLFVMSANFDATEMRFLDAREPTAALQLIAPRKKAVKYYAEHWRGDFFIMTNERAVDFKIMRAKLMAHPARLTVAPKRAWETWMPHRQSRAITGFVPYRDFFAVSLREKGSEEIYIHTGGRQNGKKVALPEAAHSVTLWSDIEFDSPFIRITYQSMLSPGAVYDVEAASGRKLQRKVQRVPGWKRKAYASERVWAPASHFRSHKAADASPRASAKPTRIPISLVYRKSLRRDGSAPLYIEAYGSYGISSDPVFSISKASLLARGWIVATAHPRGGGEMGWSWHKEAKLMTKHRTYLDVIACVDHLVRRKYADRTKVALVGGSAGGMMVGAVLNLRPDLVGAALSYVPAADLLTSSLDETLAGTRLHYDETGDPRKPAVYRYLKKYSPYENVRNAEYPAILVRANMNDIRTPYWEAAKWVARLRARKTGRNPLLLKTETAAGHFGRSGRYEWIKDRAFDFAFLITTIGKRKRSTARQATERRPRSL